MDITACGGLHVALYQKISTNCMQSQFILIIMRVYLCFVCLYSTILHD